MRLPRTITGLVAVVTLLAAVPLFVALSRASSALGHLSQQTSAVLDRELVITELCSRLRMNLLDLERAARQYLVLGDPRSLEVARQRWSAVDDTISRLGNDDARAAMMPATNALAVRFAADSRRWSTAFGDKVMLTRVVNDIHALTPQAEALSAAVRADTDAQVRQLRGEMAGARQEMLVWSLTLIPLLALLTWGYSIALARPVKQIFLSIAAIGGGRRSRGGQVELPRELRRLGQQIDSVRARLAVLEEDKDRFLRQMSHELKTPLASLREGTELLREGSLGALTRRQREVAMILVEATHELEALIDNLLTFSEWRTSRRESRIDWFEIPALIDEILAAHRLRIERRNLRVELFLYEPRLLGLRMQMRVAIDNLITNAIKHSPPGGTIQISAATKANEFVLSVRDFGSGVSELDKDVIFDPFIRGPEADEQGIRGTGIGLSIVRETLLAHGGQVSVEDASPGARFVLRWPRADD